MANGDVVEVGREEAVGFRVAAHGLGAGRRRWSAGATAVGVALPDYPKGAAGRALAARWSGVRAGTVGEALASGDLVRALSLRGATHVFPAAEAPVWTTAALPTPGDEAATRAALGSAWPALEAAGATAVEALGRVADEITAVTADGRPRTKGAVSESLHGRLPGGWEPWCDRCRVHHVPDQLFRVAAVAAGLRFPGEGPEQVAGPRPDPGDHPGARAELVRRFLGAYAPATAAAFAEWCGVGPAEAEASFAALGDEVVEVRLGGKPARALAPDLRRLRRPPAATGLRLVPAGDPFLQQRDRATLLPDADHRRRLWRPAGTPGLVLVDGAPAGTWRHRRAGGGARTEVTVTAWSPVDTDAFRAEAATVLATPPAQVDVTVEDAGPP